jgi:hypothetical protein
MHAWLSRRGQAPPANAAVSAPAAAASNRSSLVILNWQRPDNVRQILDRYTGYGVVDDILVWNNNHDQPFHYAHPKVRCINSDEFGLNTRWLGCACWHGTPASSSTTTISSATRRRRSTGSWRFTTGSRIGPTRCTDAIRRRRTIRGESGSRDAADRVRRPSHASPA